MAENVRYHTDFASRFIPRHRTIAVWLPPEYELHPDRRFPVLYLHDGQNLFDAETAFANNPWHADEVAERAIREGMVEPLILVGVANLEVERIREYGPRRCGPEQAADWSRDYGRFLVEEVKPFVDTNYRTLREPKHTGVGGSSMGGLISLYLCKWYPKVFRKCLAMSPALWWERDYFLQSLSVWPAWMRWCRVWLDMGTREGSTEFGMAAMVRRAEQLARAFGHHGMREGEQLYFKVIEDGLHTEAAWAARLDRALAFLFPATAGSHASAVRDAGDDGGHASTES